MDISPITDDGAVGPFESIHDKGGAPGLDDSTMGFDASVAIIADPAFAAGYLIESLLPDAIRLPLFEVPPGIEFKLFIFHTDLTNSSRLPIWRSRFSWMAASAGAVVWNASATDISKRCVHRTVEALGLPSLKVSDELSPGTLVIVKSDQNCGGLAESRMAGTGVRPTRVHQIAGTKNYLVCEFADVENDLRQHAQVVIERYVENARGAFFRGYRAGSRLVICQSESKDQIKQMGFGKPRKSVFLEAPHQNRCCESEFQEAARQTHLITSELGLQFGTVDLVMDDKGILHVCDVNATPFWEESEPEIEVFLRQGIISAIN